MAALMWEEMIENYVRGEQNEALHQLVKDVAEGRGTIEKYIESMGLSLTSTDTKVRCRGVQMMAEVMSSLPRNLLNEQQVTVLLEFFCARLLDHYSITPHTLKGFLALSSQSRFPVGFATSVMTAIFKEVQVQTLVQVDRRTVYNLMANLLRTSIQELQAMGSEFVLGVLHAVDGEKDPRNLILVFNILPTVINNFSIDMFVEETFEVVACYFPIDFRPPPNDPYNISREDLVEGLKTCLSCTPKFAQFCLPLIMEKLSSDLQSARLDSYQLLQACAPTYHQGTLLGYLEPIWAYCRKELMQGVSVELDAEALKTLRAVVAVVSTGVQTPASSGGGDGDLMSFLRNVLIECRQHLCEPNHRMIHPCSKLLVAMASASYPACIIILRYAIPLLMDQLSTCDQTRDRMVLLDVIQRLVHTGHNFLAKSDEWKSVFAHHASSVTAAVLSIMMETTVPDLRQSALETLAELVQVPLLMDQKNLDLVGQELLALMLKETNKNVRSECIQTVSCLARQHTDYVKEVIMTPLWTTVLKGEPGYHELLNDMAEIVTRTSEAMSMMLVSELMDKIQDMRIKEDYHCVYLTTLQTVTQKLASSTASCHESLLSSVIYPFLKMVASAALLSSVEAGKCPHCCGEVLVCVAKVIRSIVPHLDSKRGSELCQCVVDVFLHGDLNRLDLKNESKLIKFSPLNPSAPVHQSQLVTIVQPVVCSLRRDIVIPSSKELMTSLLYIAAHSTLWLASTTAAKALAGIVNKHSAGSILDDVLTESERELSGQLSVDKEGLAREQALMAWVLLTKALLMRSHPRATPFLSALLRMLSDQEFRGEVPRSLGLIVEDMREVLSEETHADIRLTYKQRVFIQSLPAISALFGTEGQQSLAMEALCELLPSVPRPVLLAELPPLVPRLVGFLRQVDPRPALPILSILTSLVGENIPAITEQLDSLVPTLLQLCNYEASMKVRITALECIGALTSLPYHQVFPYQQTVVRALTARLDDKKRLVRKEAVAARTKWILLKQDT
ncbi:MMS19 nucleotide excision repair protein homolog [Diadema antillarum]|uniref:MMS19 nucleotide excision repair protein homolog n=1 Tax=Diadema antillarum TaxID=105358 RepID=UPI003A8BF465